MQANFLFSKQLRQRAIDYFKEHCGLELTHEEAEQYLDELGELYLAFRFSPLTCSPPSPRLRGDGGSSLLLDKSHTK